MLTGFIDKTQWQDSANKLKAVLKHHGLLFDPARTADIASVMRLPGTLNYKYDPPKPVEIIELDEALIPADTFLAKIDELYAAIPQESTVSDTVVPDDYGFGDFDDDSDDEYLPPDMDGKPEYELDLPSLRSALSVLDPDCSEFEWKFYRMAALANAARENPKHAKALFKLACDFSSGKLRGKPSVKWVTPSTPSGKSGHQIIFHVWNRFLKSTSDKKATVGTIYHHACNLGWTYSPEDCHDSDEALYAESED